VEPLGHRATFTVWNRQVCWNVEELLSGSTTLERAEPTTGRWHEVVLRA
jgi:hypothetical protein